MRIRPMSGAFVFLAALSILGGCVDNDTSLSINRFIPPDPAALGAGMCKFDPSLMLNQTRGTYDLSLAKVFKTGYDANFVVANNLLKIDNAPVDTQYYYVSAFDVTLEVSGPIQTVIPATKRQFSFPSGTIRLAPAGVAAAYAQVIDPHFVQAMIDLQVDEPGSILAHIRPVATRGENQVTGAWADFPIDICNNCLSGVSDSGFGACPINSAAPAVGNVCNPSQDVPIDCCKISQTSDALACGNAAKPSST